MKGILLKFLSMYKLMDRNTKDSSVTYEIIDPRDPGAVIWRRMSKDLKRIYQDDSNYGINLISGLKDICPGATSWGGYTYQYGLEDPVGVRVIYVFIEAEHG